MDPPSALYEDAVRLYIRMVERDSTDAADALEQIYSTFGARAALRAALIIQVLKMEIRQGNYPAQIRFYGYLLQDYPEIVPLLEQAVAYCLRMWGIYDLDVQLKVGNQLYG